MAARNRICGAEVVTIFFPARHSVLDYNGAVASRKFQCCRRGRRRHQRLSGALDTSNELAAALGNHANFSATVTNSLAGKLAKALNLSDLGDASAARINLGLGSTAAQDSEPSD